MVKFNLIFVVTIFTIFVASAPLVVWARVCCNHTSKLAYYGNNQSVKEGACGYRSFAAELNGGNVAAATPTLYRNGVGCGACYQIRCLDPKLCSNSGTKIMVTDLTQNNHTDFVVPKSTFSSLALPKRAPQLLKADIVDIEYKRISCEYKGHNLTVKVEESSYYPYYLAVQFLYQGGQTEIVAVDVATVDSGNWKAVEHRNGAVWAIPYPPRGALQFRITVTSGYDGYTLWTKNSVLPSRWTVKGLYNSGLQINQTDLGPASGCYTC